MKTILTKEKMIELGNYIRQSNTSIESWFEQNPFKYEDVFTNSDIVDLVNYLIRINVIDMRSTTPERLCAYIASWRNNQAIYNPKTISVNGFDVEDGISVKLYNQMKDQQLGMYYVDFLHAERVRVTYGNLHSAVVEDGIVYIDKHKAIARAKAMLGIDPHGEQ